jgi:hypothetical protein
MREIFMSGSARGDEAMPRRLLYLLKQGCGCRRGILLLGNALEVADFRWPRRLFWRRGR